MKPVYLLAGGRGGDRKKLADMIRLIITDSGKKSPVIAYVGAATDDSLMFFKTTTLPFFKIGAAKINRILLASGKADISKAKDQLSAADIIYFGGGDVERGMQVLEEKNMVGFMKDLSLQDKLFFGRSAGSIMLAQEWVRWRDPDDDSTVEIFPCLGIAQVICDTHAEEDNWQELKTLLEIAPTDLTGYGITSDTAIKVLPDRTVEALGGKVSCFRRKSCEVMQEADLLPIS